MSHGRFSSTVAFIFLCCSFTHYKERLSFSSCDCCNVCVGVSNKRILSRISVNHEFKDINIVVVREECSKEFLPQSNSSGMEAFRVELIPRQRNTKRLVMISHLEHRLS